MPNRKFNPDLIEHDYLSVTHRMESYCFDFRLSPHDFFTCLVLILKFNGPPIDERRLCIINSLSEGIVKTDLIMNLIVWRHLEQKIRTEKRLAPTDRVAEMEIITAGKAYWKNSDLLMVWKQAEKQLRREQCLQESTALPKDQVEKRYQELILKREQPKNV